MKHALITFGNEESYGLSFVGGELLRYDQQIRFFDSDNFGGRELKEWGPDYLMFSPLTTFFPAAYRLATSLKTMMPSVKTVFGGHHVMSDPTVIKNVYIDTVVKGPVRGSIPRILNGERGVIETEPTNPEDLPKPARAEYFRDIPRIANRYRKFVLSMLGCPWNCSYCSSSSSHIKEIFGTKAYKNYYLKRRPVPDVIDEISEIMKYDTHEIEWVDDDIFAGDKSWLLDFAQVYTRNFDVPMYVSATSVSVLRTSSEVLRKMKNFINVVGMGVQAIRPESLTLFNRGWDSEGKMKAAYDRLTSFGYRVNLQGIVGLPVDDPVEDAIETVMGMARIGPGSICSVYPLMIYPGTAMEEYCRDKSIPLNHNCSGDTNNAVCGIKFTDDIQNKLRNICKLATFFVKYNFDETLVRALIECEFDHQTSQDLSMLRYKECVIDRLGATGERIFNDILKNMKLRY